MPVDRESIFSTSAALSQRSFRGKSRWPSRFCCRWSRLPPSRTTTGTPRPSCAARATARSGSRGNTSGIPARITDHAWD